MGVKGLGKFGNCCLMWVLKFLVKMIMVMFVGERVIELKK